jgi:hypothetical protein
MTQDKLLEVIEKAENGEDVSSFHAELVTLCEIIYGMSDSQIDEAWHKVKPLDE